MKKLILLAVALSGLSSQLTAEVTNAPFTGQIRATLARGGDAQQLITTAGTDCLRMERAETDRPYARNLIDRRTGEVTLLYPHNRSFMRLSNNTASAPVRAENVTMPQMPSGIGPQPASAPPAIPAVPQMPAMGGGMPAMPMMPMPAEPLELTATEGVTNLLGFACRRYELKQRGEIMEIWAAQTNLPFAPYLQNQPPRFGPRMIEEQWADLVAAKKLFPLLAVLKFENGPERLRYEVRSITPQKPEDQSEELFRPPPDYQQLEPLPF